MSPSKAGIDAEVSKNELPEMPVPDAMPAYTGLDAWQADAATWTGHVDTFPYESEMPGFCEVCAEASSFVVAVAAGEGHVSLRETLACIQCRCNARQRAAAALLLQAVAGQSRPRVYLTEQASPTFIALRRRLPGLHGSEFDPSLRRRLRLSAWLWRQRIPTWVRHGDVTALRFADAGLDAICSLDVLEHVPDHRAALREFARVLKPGASLVLTVPFYYDRAESRKLATVRADGGIEHLAPPEYHGDPLGGGVLCFHHFGWDLLDDMRAAGFASAEAVRVHDPARGWPQALWLLRAVR